MLKANLVLVYLKIVLQFRELLLCLAVHRILLFMYCSSDNSSFMFGTSVILVNDIIPNPYIIDNGFLGGGC